MWMQGVSVKVFPSVEVCVSISIKSVHQSDSVRLCLLLRVSIPPRLRQILSASVISWIYLAINNTLEYLFHQRPRVHAPDHSLK